MGYRYVCGNLAPDGDYRIENTSNPLLRKVLPRPRRPISILLIWILGHRPPIWHAQHAGYCIATVVVATPSVPLPLTLLLPKLNIWPPLLACHPVPLPLTVASLVLAMVLRSA